MAFVAVLSTTLLLSMVLLAGKPVTSHDAIAVSLVILACPLLAALIMGATFVGIFLWANIVELSARPFKERWEWLGPLFVAPILITVIIGCIQWLFTGSFIGR